MATGAASRDLKRRTEPSPSDSRPEADYDEWLAAEIDAGCAELDAGMGIPAQKAWKDVGLE